MRVMTYEEYRKTAGGLDVVGFETQPGRTSLFGFFIQAATASNYTHVGYVLRSGDSVLLAEAVETGVRTIDLRSRVAGALSRGEKVRVRRVRAGQALTSDEDEMLERWTARMRGRPYEQNYLELARASWPGRALFGASAVEDPSTLFCSELVVEALEEMVRLKETAQLSNRFAPVDVMEDAEPFSLCLESELVEITR